MSLLNLIYSDQQVFSYRFTKREKLISDVIYTKNILCLKTVKKIASRSSIFFQNSHLSLSLNQNQGIQKGEVSLYHWSPLRLIWNQLYDNWQLLFLFEKQANPNRSNRRWTVQWYFPFSILWPEPPLWEKLILRKIAIFLDTPLQRLTFHLFVTSGVCLIQTQVH